MKKLTPEQHHVLREKGTEPAFSGQYWKHKEKGKYKCAGCGAELFVSDEKFDSDCGWPSFSEAKEDAIKTESDFKLIIPRTEVHCKKCGGHLGHVFNDGPKPSGKRYCINSLALDFEK